MVERLALRVGEVAEALGISRSRTYELIAQGDIPTIRIGKSRRVPVDALRAWVARRLPNEASVDLESTASNQSPIERVVRQRH